MTFIASRDNARVRRWRALMCDARERRTQRRVLIEGEKLILAFLQSGHSLAELILSKTAAQQPELALLAERSGKPPVVLSDTLFRHISATQAPAGIAAEIAIPSSTQDLKTVEACVFLEAVQDAGNVGAILRSAAAFGIRDVVLGPGCADVWSPKVLRAAAGAHFAMRIAESADLVVDLDAFGGTLVCTAPRGGIALCAADLAGRVGWIFGAEGQGVSDTLAARATLKVTIPMPGSIESLNVAAAAAILFYAFSRRGARV